MRVMKLLKSIKRGIFDGPTIPDGFWLPYKIDPNVIDFSHEDYTYLTFLKTSYLETIEEVQCIIA